MSLGTCISNKWCREGTSAVYRGPVFGNPDLEPRQAFVSGSRRWSLGKGKLVGKKMGSVGRLQIVLLNYLGLCTSELVQDAVLQSEMLVKH